MAISPLLFSEDSNPPADGNGGVLVVSGDHDDADTGLLAELDGRSNLHPGGVKHANDTDEGEVDFVLGKLGGVVEVPVGGVGGGVAGGKGKAPEGVAASTILNSAIHDLGPELLSHGLLGGAIAGHALPVPGELKGDVLLPLGVQVLLDNLGLFQTSSSLGHTVGVDLLSQGD